MASCSVRDELSARNTHSDLERLLHWVPETVHLHRVLTDGLRNDTLQS